MSDQKAARLAAIRAANAQKQAGGAFAGKGVGMSMAGEAAMTAASAQKTAAGAPAGEGAGMAAPGEAAIAAASARMQPLGAAVVEGRPAEERAAQPHPVQGPAHGAPVTTPSIPLGRGAGDPTDQAPALGAGQLGLLLLAAVGGAFAAAVALPAWLPGLSASLLGAEPKAYWYLARSTAFVAYGLLWLSMALGLMMTNKLARLWPGGPVAFDLHQHASILGLAFGLFHALILLGDSYTGFTLGQILIPFASAGYEPLWVGLGQVGLYLMGIVGLSFYVRPLIGRRGWRLIHFISFLVFGLVLLHGVQSGSDSGAAWAQAVYWLSGGSLLFLTVYRVMATAIKPASAARRATPAPPVEALAGPKR